MKKLLLAFCLTSSIAFAEEQVVEIPSQCFPTKSLIKKLGDFTILANSQDSTSSGAALLDLLVFSKTKNAVFVLRENREIGYTCVLSMFEKK